MTTAEVPGLFLKNSSEMLYLNWDRLDQRRSPGHITGAARAIGITLAADPTPEDRLHSQEE